MTITNGWTMPNIEDLLTPIPVRYYRISSLVRPGNIVELKEQVIKTLIGKDIVSSPKHYVIHPDDIDAILKAASPDTLIHIREWKPDRLNNMCYLENGEITLYDRCADKQDAYDDNDTFTCIGKGVIYSIDGLMIDTEIPELKEHLTNYINEPRWFFVEVK